MCVEIVADARSVAEFVHRRQRGLVATAIATAPPAALILIADYRFMIFAIILLALPLIAAADLVRLRRTVGAGGTIALRCATDAVELRSIHERVAYAPNEVVARVTPDMIVVAAKARMWVVPASREAANGAGVALRRAGAKVAFERGGIATLAVFFGMVVLDLALGVVATGLFIGGFANVILAATHRGGSWVLGAELLTSTLAVFTIAAVLRFLRPR